MLPSSLRPLLLLVGGGVSLAWAASPPPAGIMPGPLATPAPEAPLPRPPPGRLGLAHRTPAAPPAPTRAAVPRAAREPTPGRRARTPVRRAPSPSAILARYRRVVRSLNAGLNEEEAGQIARLVLDSSERHGLDARLVLAMIACESNFEEDAVSPAGAQGLGQLMPATAAALGVADAFDVEENLNASARLLSRHLAAIAARNRRARPSARDLHLALACYNAGAGAIQKYGGVPPYRETNRYIRRITRLYYRFAARGGLPGARPGAPGQERSRRAVGS
jgi:soluble lytic murein transglycosylase-like protein